jgi:hypothetical protein
MAFDLIVDHRDNKNGRVTKHVPYTRYASQQGVIYLRDGVFYTESGQVAPDHFVESVVGREVFLAHKKPEANTPKK